MEVLVCFDTQLHFRDTLTPPWQDPSSSAYRTKARYHAKLERDGAAMLAAMKRVRMVRVIRLVEARVGPDDLLDG